MLFNSYHFLLFFPLVVILYFLIPIKFRWIWLLVTSYYFYGCWHISHIVLLVYATGVSWLGGRLIDRLREKAKVKKAVLFFSIAACFASLFLFKYGNWVMDMMGLKRLSVSVPMGISFYTFQAVSYIVDIYREKVSVQKNIFRYALYVSFFPQLVAGPIERSDRLMPQVNKEHKFNYENFRYGFMLMLWGYFLKLVIADRASIFIDNVYGDISGTGGIFIIIATVLFAFQIYCDFAGYSLIAMGSARILGFELMENFDAPYLSKSVSEFWRRWHISLSSWFKDYVYIPLGGSRKGKARKCINIMTVFLLSGLWHGADFSYVIWGGLNGVYHLIEEFTNKITKKVPAIIKTITTFILVDIAWVFFRASDTKTAIEAVKKMTDVQGINDFGTDICSFGLDKANWIVLLIAFAIMIIADICKNRKIQLRPNFFSQSRIIRCTEIILIIMGLLIFGNYGSGVGGAFIYFQF